VGVVLDDKHKLLGRSEQETKKLEITKKVNLLSKQALSSMTKDKVIPTPENYKSYFEKQLEKRTSQEKKAISELLLDKEDFGDQYIATLEKDIQDAYLNVKKMTESIAHSFSKLLAVRKKAKVIHANHTAANLVSFQEELAVSLKHLDSDLKSIKESYTQTAELINNFNKNSIYDKKYGIYNKKYLLMAIDETIKKSAMFDYPNTLVAIRIKPQILQKVSSKRDKELLSLNLAKLLYKRSRRSDIIAHYEDGIFMMLLKHTNLEFAKTATERIEDSVEEANFMVDENVIEVELDFGIAAIEADAIKESVIVEAIDNLS